MIRKSWTEHKTNGIVLNEINEKRTVINTVLKRTIELIGHLLRHNVFVIIIMEGKIEGRRSRGRPCKSFFEEIFRRMGCWHMKNMIGYNNKAWTLEAHDDDISISKFDRSFIFDT
jgi:hypothetical protein